jgi:hypothetical protein
VPWFCLLVQVWGRLGVTVVVMLDWIMMLVVGFR